MSIYGSLRSHQETAIARAEEVVTGIRPDKCVVAHVTPGGGKTMLASIYAHELIRLGVVDRVCVICPRDSLRTQVQQAFTDPVRGLVLQVVAEGNRSIEQAALPGSSVGYVTTYQAVVAHSKRHAKRFKRNRYLLVLDEAHHLAGQDEDDDERSENYAAWHGAVSPLVERARAVLVMTGTMHRADRRHIPFVRYVDDKPIADIRYTRRDALREKAVLPIEFTLWDGQSRYFYRGKGFDTPLSEAPSRERSRSLANSLGDLEGYVLPMLTKALASWAEYRREHYKSKAIVVCRSQASARDVMRRIPEIVRGVCPVLAISSEPRSARTIQRFRDGIEGDVLVTVGMAYEGLDVPDATHLICLSNRRARSWIEQAFARVTRVNRACSLEFEQQVAHIWAPDDPLMRALVDTFQDEQDAAARDAAVQTGRVIPLRKNSSFIPDACDITTPSFADTDGLLNATEGAIVQRIRESAPELANLPARRLLQLSAVFNGGR